MIIRYTNRPKGIDTPNRALLDELVRSVHGPFTPAEAGRLLATDTVRARKLLAYLAARGWLSRIRSGLYTTVPLGASTPAQWREDPWIVAATSFAPCYIAGWSAAEHWHLTEQIFRDIMVITAAPIRRAHITIQDTPFLLHHRKESYHFGLAVVWRAQTRVQVSDPTRTVIDILDNPAMGGGIVHVAEILHDYLKGEHRDDDKIITYADRLGNRTVMKRLGYLLEMFHIDATALMKACLDRRSAGLAKLDPSSNIPGRITKRWGLRVNATVQPRNENP
jgi:predicted transcriptional regulator of viral defense system